MLVLSSLCVWTDDCDSYVLTLYFLCCWILLLPEINPCEFWTLSYSICMLECIYTYKWTELSVCQLTCLILAVVGRVEYFKRKCDVALRTYFILCMCKGYNYIFCSHPYFTLLFIHYFNCLNRNLYTVVLVVIKLCLHILLWKHPEWATSVICDVGLYK